MKNLLLIGLLLLAGCSASTPSTPGPSATPTPAPGSGTGTIALSWNWPSIPGGCTIYAFLDNAQPVNLASSNTGTVYWTNVPYGNHQISASAVSVTYYIDTATPQVAVTVGAGCLDAPVTFGYKP